MFSTALGPRSPENSSEIGFCEADKDMYLAIQSQLYKLQRSLEKRHQDLSDHELLLEYAAQDLKFVPVPGYYYRSTRYPDYLSKTC
jgi:hypothetical protein